MTALRCFHNHQAMSMITDEVPFRATVDGLVPPVRELDPNGSLTNWANTDILWLSYYMSSILQSNRALSPSIGRL
jgi:hypothetical protein